MSKVVDWTKHPYWHEFVDFCEQNGFDAYADSFASPTLTAKLGFFWAIDMVEEKNGVKPTSRQIWKDADDGQ